MSVLLLQSAQAYLRAQFTHQEVLTLEPYGGQFHGQDLGKVSISCPAILLTVLGWQPVPAGSSGRRMAGRNVRDVRLAAFVVTKHTKREARMLAAMNLADRVSMALTQWRPDTVGQPYSLAALDEDAACENLFGAAVDAKGMALWMVDWRQCMSPAPGVSWAELADLLHIEITDTVHQGDVPATPAPDAPLSVTEGINFTPRI